ncbi:MAG TPA: alpha/beta hydrolase, partial [Polyangiaceae bacterium]|nr:alpha/beta hydrolase [Polyangiaceae bacterium]
GADGPWVVLVHGLFTPMEAWAGLAEALAAAGFRVLRYDQFGRGLSERIPFPHTLDRFVRQLGEMLDAFGIGAAHVVSWSMGGLVAGNFALEHPERVLSQVFIAPGFFLSPPLRLRVLASLPGREAAVAALAPLFVDRLPAQQFRQPERAPGYRERLREYLDCPGTREALASTLVHYPWNFGAELRSAGEHPRPVLVLWGDADPVTPYANAARVVELFPRARLVTFPGAKHGPHLEHAEQAQGEIVTFLRSFAPAGPPPA